MSKSENVIAIQLSFLGVVPDRARDRIDPERDRLGVDTTGMIRSATWRHPLDSTQDYRLDYWDRGFAELLDRLGGIEPVVELAEQAQQLSGIVHFHRESMEPDIVDGDGPFSYDSNYVTICLSNRTLSQIGALGFGIHVTQRVVKSSEKAGSVD